VDVMAGFPGETEKAFQNTLGLIENMPIAYLHVFPFSSHEGTTAANLSNHVSPQVIKTRCRQLRQLGQAKRQQFYQRFVGTTQQVLVEGKREKDSEYVKGFTKNYIPVSLAGDDTLYHQLVTVKIEVVKDGIVLGKLSSHL
jgi:threonylcarbamoyladenosine tRNA methylthiotransferase MtaB